jgi:hypothetical protein
MDISMPAGKPLAFADASSCESFPIPIPSILRVGTAGTLADVLLTRLASLGSEELDKEPLDVVILEVGGGVNGTSLYISRIAAFVA